MIELLLRVGLLAVTFYTNNIHNSISLWQCGVFWMHLLVATHKFTIQSIVYAAFHFARCRRLSGVSKLCRLAIQGMSATLDDYALVLAKNMEKFVCNFRWMMVLLIQSVIIVKVTNVKAAVSGKRQIPVEVVSLTVASQRLLHVCSKRTNRSNWRTNLPCWNTDEFFFFLNQYFATLTLAFALNK